MRWVHWSDDNRTTMIREFVSDTRGYFIDGVSVDKVTFFKLWDEAFEPQKQGASK